jgi:hypothetical protein
MTKAEEVSMKNKFGIMEVRLCKSKVMKAYGAKRANTKDPGPRVDILVIYLPWEARAGKYFCKSKQDQVPSPNAQCETKYKRKRAEKRQQSTDNRP